MQNLHFYNMTYVAAFDQSFTEVCLLEENFEIQIKFNVTCNIIFGIDYS